MKKIILYLGIAVSFVTFNFYNLNAFGDIIPNPLEYTEMPFDVLHYDVNLDLRNYSTREVTGTCKILVKRKDIYDGDYFIFHLQSLKVLGITSNIVSMQYSAYLDESSPQFHYRVYYPDNISDTVEFVISYSGKMTSEIGGNMSWGGAFYEEAVLYTIGVGFRAPYISTSRHWMPCFDLPQDKATYKGTFKVPAHFQAASNGLLKEIRGTTDGAKEYVWEHNFPSATYMLTFAAGPYQLLDYKDYKIPIQIFSLLVDSARSDFAYSEVPQMNECYEKYFGDFPYDKIGFANTTKGAMEHQTMISMPRSVVVQLHSKNNSNNLTAVHELAHSWFGGSVTPIDFRHAWLSESFATYCESLWLECRDGNSAYKKSQIDKAYDYLNNISKSEGIFPLYDFPRNLPSSNYPGTIYQKGAVVLGMLDYALFKSGFNIFDIMKKYLEKFAYSNAGTEDFIKVLEDETKLDWDWFFDQWVYSAGWSRIEILFDDVQNNKYSSHLQIKQIQEGMIFKNLPVELKMFFSNGKDSTFIVNLENEITELQLAEYYNYKIDSVKANQGEIVAGLYELKKVSAITSVENNTTEDIEIFQDGEYVNINFQSNGSFCKLNVVDLLGNSVHSDELINKSGMNSFRFYLNNSQTGIYFVNLLIDGMNYTQKISLIR
ncbi:MAG: M1 family aminopeptidase [Candidatus Kapabacteria bacterium]|nr:M1 family aminopeptidase [Candidatus Kapabacteria bacterium]